MLCAALTQDIFADVYAVPMLCKLIDYGAVSA